MDFGIYGAYFTNTRTLGAVIIPVIALTFLYLLFKKSRNPTARSWNLGLMLFSSIFLWLFLGISLILCFASAEAYETALESTVANVFGSSLLLALGSGLPLAFLLRYVSPKIVLGKVKNLTAPSSSLANWFEALRMTMGVPAVELKLSSTRVPLSFVVDSKQPVVVISERLVTLLGKDELEAVMAHELAHLKNSDTTLKALVTAYKTALPHDPVIRLVEAAFHREREMVADETAAKATQKPLSLASALLKIYEAFPKNNLSSYGTLSILGAGSSLMSRHPPIRHRIIQLIRMAEATA